MISESEVRNAKTKVSDTEAKLRQAQEEVRRLERQLILDKKIEDDQERQLRRRLDDQKRLKEERDRATRDQRRAA